MLFEIVFFLSLTVAQLNRLGIARSTPSNIVCIYGTVHIKPLLVVADLMAEFFGGGIDISTSHL